MSIITILLFFLYSWGFGYTLSKLAKNSEDFFERNAIRIGLGLCVFSLIGILLNLFHIPLDWKIFLALSAVFPVYSIFKKIKKNELNLSTLKSIKPNLPTILIFFIFFALFFTYLSGSFNYPYLEDDDSWSYSEAVKYIAVEKTLNDNLGIYKFLDPYPPFYVSLMGILHQTSSSMSWTLKFFNALIISLGILFFYFAVKKFTKSESMALSSSFVLAVLPCFYTHFIWAISLSIPLFFIAIYCIEKTDEDKKWTYALAISISGIMLAHPAMTLKIMILLSIYILIKCIVKKQILKHSIFGIAGGIALSGLWWITKWQNLLASRVSSDVLSSAQSVSTLSKVFEYLLAVFASTSGTATRAYTFNDFFIARDQGLINVPTGFGIMASLLLLLGFVYLIKNYKQIINELKNKENYWIPIVLAWLIITFLNINSVTFNLPGFFSFRTWLLIAIPVALLCSLGLNFSFEIGKKFDVPTLIIILLFILGLIATAGYQKYTLNTSTWPPGQGWVSLEEVQAHSWLKTLPDNTKVFSYGNSPVIGYDKYSCEWCEDEISFRETLLNKTPSEIYSFLKLRGYEYLLISGKAYINFGKKVGDEEAKEKIDNFLETIPTNLYSVVYQTNGGVILKLV